MDEPIYHGKVISRLDSLAWILGRPAVKLIQIAGQIDKYYVANEPFIKPNGSVRQTYIVRQPLRTIQSNILRGILNQVVFPPYLQGAIKGRDFIADAKIHKGNKVILHEDIRNFFPSVSRGHVFSVWRYYFHFSQAAANLLVSLTTYNGFLPQGACTSPAIANLLFWDREPRLVANFNECGITYSRFIDDIQVSSKRLLSQVEIGRITTSIYKMITSLGFQPQRHKRDVQTGHRRRVHSLNLHSGNPTICIKRRSNIRAAVKELESLASRDLPEEDYQKQYAKVMGRLGFMARLHPYQAKIYQRRIKAIKRK